MPEENKKSITIFKTPSWGILGTAFLIMLICKCGGWYPDLSWWIVTAPLWGPWALVIGMFVGFYLFAFVGALCVGVIGLVLGVFFAIWDFFAEKVFKRKDNI